VQIPALENGFRSRCCRSPEAFAVVRSRGTLTPIVIAYCRSHGGQQRAKTEAGKLEKALADS